MNIQISEFMSHNHDHSHEVKDFNNAFKFGIILNSVYIIIEFTYGFLVNSMSLIADAGHNLSDVLGLVLAWGAAVLAKRVASKAKTYGFKKTTILAAFVNSVVLLIALGAILMEAIRKLFNPEPVDGITVMIVSFIGVIINTLTALLFMKGSKEDLNIKGAFLHMAADAAVSLGVVIAGVVIYYTNWTYIDPLLSIVIVIIIASGTWNLLKDSFNLSIDAVPEKIDFDEVKDLLTGYKFVEDVHDLHIWALSTTETALTAHIKVSEEFDSHEEIFLDEVYKKLHNKFGIEHSTIQIEREDFSCNHNCLPLK